MVAYAPKPAFTAEIAGKHVQTPVLMPATITLDLPVLLIEEVIRGSSKGFTVVRSIISWSFKSSANSGKIGPNIPFDIVVIATIGTPSIWEARARPTTFFRRSCGSGYHEPATRPT